MIIVAGIFTFDPAHQSAFVAAAGRVAEATRTEDGCISYEFFADLAEEGRVHLFEEWEEEHHLLAHFEAPHFAEFSRELDAIGIRSRDVNRYHVSRYGPNRPS
ncbi:MAG: antibiotic biosynthesis monooxygenase [Acidimicrobiia bacterium]|nr:antibiotic biosynthesis monooxygenase [Acidimicrobiia bacterium]MDH3470312.1 antibiotic biosynthesis monooxygenase [Acidimicrobiia bacterium]